MAATRHIAETLLREAHSPDTAAAIFADKVLHKPLHLRPTSPDPTSQDARAKRRIQRLLKEEQTKRRRKVKPLSAKEKRVSGIYDIPDNAKKYEIYKPLHRMWVGYMWEILGMKEGAQNYLTAQTTGSKLTSADYHGAEVAVVRSRCTNMIGLRGIVVRDTKFTFQIINQENELKIIPKKYTVFRFEIPQAELRDEQKERSVGDAEEETEDQFQNLIFELHGSQFENRAADRSMKKYKWQKLTDI